MFWRTASELRNQIVVQATNTRVVVQISSFPACSELCTIFALQYRAKNEWILQQR